MKMEFIAMLIFSPSIISLSRMVLVCKAYRENTAVIWYQHIAHLLLAQMFILQVCFSSQGLELRTAELEQ